MDQQVNHVVEVADLQRTTEYNVRVWGPLLDKKWQAGTASQLAGSKPD